MSNNTYRMILAHSAKGSTWKKHKYIAIKDGRYIYDEKDKEQFEKDVEKYKDAYSRDVSNNMFGIAPNYSEEALRYQRANAALAAMRDADSANNPADKHNRTFWGKSAESHDSDAQHYDKQINKLIQKSSKKKASSVSPETKKKGKDIALKVIDYLAR